ncbi:MAG: ABC-F family ATP-binding cassette domain-containing protein [Bacteroidales bacterium]|nr:ABC-F family ATP-binding cassette domain-containing protein [Bacteroidales bacterium]
MISVSDIAVYFGARDLFSGVTFNIRAHDRIGLTGLNGTGKSTLLKVLAGELTPDSGYLSKPKGLRIGYLPQHIRVNDTRMVFEEVASSLTELNMLETEIARLTGELGRREDYHTEEYLNLANRLAETTERFHLLEGGRKELMIGRTLTGLGFRPEDFEKPTGTFSGGWRMRIELAKVLLQQPDVLLLDEPTNHLDIESIQWLEDYFTSFKGSLILVSHDKALLDHVTIRTLELENRRITDYPAPYSRYLVMKEERMMQQKAAYRNQQKWIEQTEHFIERFRYKATKAVQVQSRIKQLDKLERVDPVETDNRKVRFSFRGIERSGDIVAEMKKISKSFGENQVLKNIDLLVRRGEKIAFVGRNGEGKTTLARIIVGDLPDYEGGRRTGAKVQIGYYAQDQAEKLDPAKTVFDIVDEAAVGEVRSQIRSLLGAFLFQGEEVEKKVSVLSGGERSRLALLRLLIHPANFLVLDEPTNHLDMRTKNILKQTLKDFSGTLLIVSHDRDFLDGLVDTIYEIHGHKLTQHDGDIYRFLEKKKLESLNDLDRKGTIVQSAQDTDRGSKKNYQERKRRRNKLRSLQQKIEKLESEINEMETRKKSMEKQLEDPTAYQLDFDRLSGEYAGLQKILSEKLDRWAELHEELENQKQTES